MTEVRCWRDQAACRDLVTAEYDPFFADSAELQAEAIAVCETCPVRDDCLTFAVRTGQQYSIWGGQPQQIIRRLIALERAGRPYTAGSPPVATPVKDLAITLALHSASWMNPPLSGTFRGCVLVERGTTSLWGQRD